jgi:hypothetical protein
VQHLPVPLMKKNRVDACLCGHDHHVEHIVTADGLNSEVPFPCHDTRPRVRF